ncbi:MAG: hypothetical protein Pars2KO_23400 [Parasphingorhabdus sp.]
MVNEIGLLLNYVMKSDINHVFKALDSENLYTDSERGFASATKKALLPLIGSSAF